MGLYIGTQKHLKLRLWICRVLNLTPVQQSVILRLLSPSEQKRLLIITNAKKRQEYLLSRYFIRQALSKLYRQRLTYWQITSHDNAPPRVINLPQKLNLGLSHTKTHIALASYPHPIGIDIEYCKPRDNLMALSEEFMQDDELHFLKEAKDKQDYFYRIWCAKEAAYKSLTRAEQLKTPLLTISYQGLLSSQNNWHILKQQRIENIRLAVVFNSSKNPATTIF